MSGDFAERGNPMLPAARTSKRIAHVSKHGMRSKL